MIKTISSNTPMAQSMYPIDIPVINRLAYMVSLINQKATGRPEQFASKIGVGKTRLTELINLIKKSGVEIEYDRTQESYLFAQGKKYSFQCRIVEKS